MSQVKSSQMRRALSMAQLITTWYVQNCCWKL